MPHLGMNPCLIFFAALFVSTTLFATERLDRLNLLQFRDAKGVVQPVKTPADWELRRAEVLKGMVTVMGPLPGCVFEQAAL